MPDFSRVIAMAYMRILGRPPDPGGLENYNRLMNEGMSEALMRESLLRSPEYADKHPDVKPLVIRAASASTKKAKSAKAARKKASRKKTATGRSPRARSRR